MVKYGKSLISILQSSRLNNVIQNLIVQHGCSVDKHVT